MALLEQVNGLLDRANESSGATPGGATPPQTDSSGQKLHVGDVVQILKDSDTVKRLQRGHGGWTDEMTELGRVAPGIIRSFDSDGDVVVDFGFLLTVDNKIELTLNPKATFRVSKGASLVFSCRVDDNCEQQNPYYLAFLFLIKRLYKILSKLQISYQNCVNL